MEKPKLKLRLQIQSEVVDLHKGAVWCAVNRTVVVNQRLSLFSLRMKMMFVLPGCEDTNERNTQVRRRSSPSRCYQRRLFPTFVNEELSRVEAGPDGRRRV